MAKPFSESRGGSICPGSKRGTAVIYSPMCCLLVRNYRVWCATAHDGSWFLFLSSSLASDRAQLCSLFIRQWPANPDEAEFLDMKSMIGESLASCPGTRRRQNDFCCIMGNVRWVVLASCRRKWTEDGFDEEDKKFVVWNNPLVGFGFVVSFPLLFFSLYLFSFHLGSKHALLFLPLTVGKHVDISLLEKGWRLFLDAWMVGGSRALLP